MKNSRILSTIAMLALGAAIAFGSVRIGGSSSIEIGEAAVEETAAIPLAGSTSGGSANLGNVNVDSGRATRIVALVNAERRKNGLGEVAYDEGLCAGATVRAMEQEKQFSHTRPDGREAFSIFADMQRPETFRGENLAAGGAGASAEQVMGLWMSSEGHRANILQSRFNKLGVGYYAANGNGYWCQLFAE